MDRGEVGEEEVLISSRRVSVAVRVRPRAEKEARGDSKYGVLRI